MTKPIAQTFYINEPVGGAEGVILTAIDIYFQSVSSTYGVEVQIRTTENGNPTSYIVPRASKVLQASDVVASSDASVPTKFTFDTPISLQTQTSYAFVIIPVGGNPDYTVWTSELGGNDVKTNSPVHTNNDTGTLFLSSNDIQFTAVQTEDIKFTLYIANFTSTSGTAVYNFRPADRINYTNLVGSFSPKETVLVSNSSFNLAALSINSNTGAFTAGEVIYQSNGSVNNATGILYSANSSKILVTNSNGAWVASPGSNTYQVVGATSAAYANTSSVSQNVVASSNSTLVVPFTGNSTANIFYANQSLYIGTNTRSTMDVAVVNAVINSTAVLINSNVSFSDSAALLGQIRGDGLSLWGRYNGPQAGDITIGLRFGQSKYQALLYDVTSNSSLNFANSEGQYFIGFTSKSSGINTGGGITAYSAVIPDFTQVTSKNTDISWTFKGIDIHDTYDSSPISITNGTETELTDTNRFVISKSIEMSQYGGNNTTTFTATMTTANSKFSPFIDTTANHVRFTKNSVGSANQIYGYYVSTSNTTGVFRGGLERGDNVTLSNGSVTLTGTVFISNPTGMFISNTSGTLTSGFTLYKTSNSSVNTYINSATEYNEKFSANVFPYLSRYMSKSVVLAENQDAEDLKLYLTAYRPGNTDFQIYGKFLHAQDQEPFSTKIWSRLQESNTSAALISSKSNVNDYVELIYNLPSSLLVFANSTTTSNTSANITITSTASISNGSYIYLYNTSSNNYIVRQVTSVANNTTLVLSSNPTFSSTNADIGIIPGLEHQTGAFLNANNSGIVRYVSSSDVVFDSYKTFAIKIVPVADQSALSPRAADYRVLALQV